MSPNSRVPQTDMQVPSPNRPADGIGLRRVLLEVAFEMKRHVWD